MKIASLVLTLAVLAAGSLTGTGVARAAVLVDYNLTTFSGTISAPATTQATGITATDITRGPGLTPISLNRGFSSQGWNNSGTTPTTRADAISGNKYYTFALTIAPGSTASFSDISVGLYKSAITSPASMEWQYSFNSFVTTGSTLTTFNHYGRNSGTPPGSLTPFQWMTVDTPGQSNGNPTPALDISTVSASRIWLVQPPSPSGSTAGAPSTATPPRRPTPWQSAARTGR